jgi:hypothetical protein
LIPQHGMNEEWHFLFFSFIARNFSTLFFSIFQVHDDGANGTLGLVMVFSLTVHAEMAHGPSSWTWKSEKGSSTFCTLLWRPLSFPPKQNENPHCWLQASGASHTWYVIGGGAGETMYSTVEHTGLGEITWRANELVATLPRSTLGGNTAEIKIWAEVKIFGGKCSVVVHPTIKSSPESIFPFKMCTASPQWGLMRWCSFAFRLSDCRTICVSLLSYE